MTLPTQHFPRPRLGPAGEASPLLDAGAFAVVGAGVSGLAATRLLRDLGKAVRLLDDREEDPSLQVEGVEEHDIERRHGPFDAGGAAEALQGIERVIVSPGIAVEHPLVRTAGSLDIPVYPEVELAWEMSDGARTVAVTGTNGKTTVTMLIRHLVCRAGLRGIETGNIGHAFSDAVREGSAAEAKTVFAAEMSSFQLETIHDFAPEVAVLLNVTPDHLDRHGSMERYVAAKRRITENQTSDQIFIINQDDPECLKAALDTRARVLRFSLNRPVDAGAWLDEDQLVWGREGSKPRKLIALDEMPLFGMHNVQNCLAAACAGLALGLDRKSVAEGLRTFTAPQHRLQPVATIGGVTYVNDSKATNVDALLKALESFHQPIHLIAGGRDKDSPFTRARGAVSNRVTQTYVIGEAADKLAECWNGATEICRCESLAEAVKNASDAAQPGEVVLLSPGCASFDQFRSYVHRGETFIAEVLRLGPNESTDESTREESSS